MVEILLVGIFFGFLTEPSFCLQASPSNIITCLPHGGVKAQAQASAGLASYPFQGAEKGEGN
jgi:hypothetical protein